ncbi:hypothetical protein [Solitalea koreensis]|uniref:Phosphoribosylpyrophosphate synthetase n=1 Tax=Solitalea koreensis TaxID=543615 RepID=A0A521AAY1_9SPHI|nr:hypothetical protein [Solitalea koreensis]SMO31952.1 hypothetical protein SAMN06265350_10122 [Solitalea koreensis]
MLQPNDMSSLVSVMEKLRMKKYDNEFMMTADGFKCLANNEIYKPEDLIIIRTYRFEGDNDPSDSSILYLIKTSNELIGYTLDSYGPQSNYEDSSFDDFIKKVPMKDHDEQQLFK